MDRNAWTGPLTQEHWQPRYQIIERQARILEARILNNVFSLVHLRLRPCISNSRSHKLWDITQDTIPTTRPHIYPLTRLVSQDNPDRSNMDSSPVIRLELYFLVQYSNPTLTLPIFQTNNLLSHICIIQGRTDK